MENYIKKEKKEETRVRRSMILWIDLHIDEKRFMHCFPSSSNVRLHCKMTKNKAFWKAPVLIQRTITITGNHDNTWNVY